MIENTTTSFPILTNDVEGSLVGPQINYRGFALTQEVLNPSEESIADVLEKLEQSMVASCNRYESFYNLHDGRCLKYARSIEEARMMEFIRVHTSIPIPKLHMIFKDDEGLYYIVMDFIPGRTIQDAYLDRAISSEQLQAIAVQLAGYVQQLRSLPILHDNKFGTLEGGPFSNVFFLPGPWEQSSDTLPSVPFQSLADFHEYWVKRSKMTATLPEFDQLSPVLTHGDLQPQNILVENGKIVALVDWESLGWYPEFWESMMIWRGAHTAGLWLLEVEKVYPPSDIYALYRDMLFSTYKEPDGFY